MKAIMVMFDTLSRRFLSTYGNEWVKTPNFERLKEKTTQFDSFYSGSLPCMPARRELHTGRTNFLHRSWGPIEPFDFSAIETLTKKGVYTHICTDHSHYWEDGGATYLPRYSSWQGFRGQEGDRWQGIVDTSTLKIPKQLKSSKSGESFAFNWANRSIRKDENDYSSVECVNAGIDFIRKNHDVDNWFLQIECFDPHEPFDVPQKYLDMYNDTYVGDYFDWPAYAPAVETVEEKEHIIKRYAALITMCDYYLGKVLDEFDTYNLWEDTMLIVNTDHGFLMGEHDWWGKNIQPFYQEVAHLPFYYYNPKQKQQNKVSDSLCQTIDIAPTLLQYFGVDIPNVVTGLDIGRIVKGEVKRNGALFGTFGAHVNVTDGKYVYMRSPLTAQNAPLYEYTLMPTRMRGFITKELTHATLSEGFKFTKGMKILKVPSNSLFNSYRFGNKLFNLESDPYQLNNINDDFKECEMIGLLMQCMQSEDAPIEQYERLGIFEKMKVEDIRIQNKKRELDNKVNVVFEITRKQQAQINMLKILANGKVDVEDTLNKISNKLSDASADVYISTFISNLMSQIKMPNAHKNMLLTMLHTADKTD